MERKEAIEVVKKNYPHVTESESQFETALRTLIPELKESEDERIWTINYLNNRKLNSSIIEEKESLKRAITWLEKQYEQNTNEIHPIFRVGDYIKNKKTSDKVLIEQLDIATKAYCYVSYDGGAEIHSDFSFSKQDEWMLIGQNIVEQKPAWSEEDEQMLQKTLSTIRYALSIPIDKEDDPCLVGSSTISWLKSLKERMK